MSMFLPFSKFKKWSSSSSSIIAPLSNPLFKLLWIGNFLSNLGTMMHAIAAAWLMTSLTTSPWLIGLVQSAFSFPILLMGIPAGVFADLLDRRLLLIIAQCWMMFFVLLMSLLAVLGKMTPCSLLILLFLIGLGAALHFPTWLALLQDLVPPNHLSAAVSLNSIAFNLARTMGPALGGLLVSILGAPMVFLANGLSFIAILLGLLRVPVKNRSILNTSQGIMNSFFQSFLEIAIFLIKSNVLLGATLRFALFMMGGAGFLGLLPLLAKENFHLGASAFGELMSLFGVGSVLGALLLPRLRSTYSMDTIIVISSLIFSVILFFLTILKTIIMINALMVILGATWILVIVNYNIAIQLSASEELKGRAISIYVVIYQGGIALSSAWMGGVASHWGVASSLLLGGMTVILSLLLIPLLPLCSSSSSLRIE